MTNRTITVKLKLDLDDLAAQFRAAADALTSVRHAANEARQRERQREEELEDAWQSRDWETVRRLQDEDEQREDAPEPDPLDKLPCPECGHGIDDHGWDGDYAITCCLACDDPGDCRKAPSDIARCLIARAVKAEPQDAGRCCTHTKCPGGSLCCCIEEAGR